LGNDYGFEKTLIAVAPERPSSLGEVFLHSNYSSQWLDIYNCKQLLAVDPTVKHCVMHTTPLLWEQATFSGKKQDEMYEEASRFGLRSGITLPLHGVNGEVGILCFITSSSSGKSFHQDALHHMPALSMLRDFAFESSMRFSSFSNHQHHHPPILTQRELECLKWCTAGKSSWEIAKILCCSEAVINFHFGNLRRKFHATSRRQVVVKAIRYGLIRPN
jgi:LuxR family quorum-sensing transcriptional regulator LasR